MADEGGNTLFWWEVAQKSRRNLEMTRTAFSCSLFLIILSSKRIMEFEEADCGEAREVDSPSRDTSNQILPVNGCLCN